MAFLKEERKKSGTYLTIANSYRDSKGKTKHERLYSLGKKEDYIPETLQRIGRRLFVLGGGKLEDLLRPIIKELGRYNYGFPFLVERLLQTYGFPRFFNLLEKEHHLRINLQSTVKLMICDRLHDPISKLGSYNFQREYLGITDIPLQHLYRTLDYLAENMPQVQQLIYQKNITLFNYELDVVFYDVTTLYFDSEKEVKDSLRQKGFSKDGKIGQTQIVFGLLIDKNKLPVGYRIYKGNKYEGHTLEDFVNVLKKEYLIKEVVVVADRGMMNAANLSLFTPEEGLNNTYHYIIGERLKSLPKQLQKHFTNRKNYQKVEIKTEDGEIVVTEYCRMEYQGRIIIGTYSQSRAEKDRIDREKLLQKSEKLKHNPSELEKKASRYFLKKTGTSDYETDQDKINLAASFDGFLVIATNNKDLSAEKILDAYKDLYKIEQSFRTFKSYLQTRPIFHWTDKRIEGHLCMCYISFCFLQNVLTTMKTAGNKITEEELRRVLTAMQVSEVEQGEERLYLRSAMDERTKALITTLKLPELPDITSKRNIANLA